MSEDEIREKAEIGKLLFHDAVGRASGRSNYEELEEFMYELGGTDRALHLPREHFSSLLLFCGSRLMFTAS